MGRVTDVARFFLEGGWPAWAVLVASIVALLIAVVLAILQASAPRGPVAWLLGPLVVSVLGAIGVRYGLSLVERVLSFAPRDQLYPLYLAGESESLVPAIVAAGGAAAIALLGLLAVSLTARRHLTGTGLLGAGAGALAVVGGVVALVVAPPASRVVDGVGGWGSAVALMCFGVAAAVVGGPLSDRRDRTATAAARVAVVVGALGVALVWVAGTAGLLIDGYRPLEVVAMAPADQRMMLMGSIAAAGFTARALRLITMGGAGLLAVMLLVVARRGVRRHAGTVGAGIALTLALIGSGVWLESSLQQSFDTLWARLPVPPAPEKLAKSTSQETLPEGRVVHWAEGEVLDLVRTRVGTPPKDEPLVLSVEANVAAADVGKLLSGLRSAGASKVRLLTRPAEGDGVSPETSAQLEALGARPVPPALNCLTVSVAAPATPALFGLLIDTGRTTLIGGRPFEARPQETGARWSTLMEHLTRIKRSFRREHTVVIAATGAVSVGDVISVLDAARETEDGHELFPAAHWLTEEELAGAIRAEGESPEPEATDEIEDDDPLVP